MQAKQQALKGIYLIAAHATSIQVERLGLQLELALAKYVLHPGIHIKQLGSITEYAASLV